MRVTLPNLITLARLLAVPLIVWLIMQGEISAAFWLFIAAGISDAVDGFLARALRARSTLGEYLDPLADKALLVSIFVTMGLVGLMPSWLVILVVSRDLLIIGAVVLSWMMSYPVTIDPAMISKANTSVQIAYAGLVLAAEGFQLEIGQISLLGAYLVGLTTFLSGLNYLIDWLRGMNDWEKRQATGPVDAGNRPEGSDT